MTRITIAVQPQPYEALVENGLLSYVGMRMREVLPGRTRCYVITVPPVRKKWARRLTTSLTAAGWQPSLIEIPDGERHKRLATVERLAEQMSAHGADRSSVVVAFGGGVVGDVSGLLASLYMRGVDLVQVPTTVLAQVDASIGGKTGVNLKAGKNLVGTFQQPRIVLIDPQVLSTLPEREFRSGLYEAVKCGVIGRPELFGRMERNAPQILRRDPPELEWLIAECARLKAEVVSADERENGLRRILNFGHTIGHALEAATGYRRFLHGEAVAWGMIAAAKIGAAVEKTDQRTATRITNAVLGFGRLPKVEVHGRVILRLLQADKKTRDGVVHFVLPTEIGKVEIVKNVSEKVVRGAMDEIRQMSRK